MSSQVLTKRKCALIIYNMCKLVVDPRDAAHFYPVLQPVLERAVDEVRTFRTFRTFSRHFRGFQRGRGGSVLARMAGGLALIRVVSVV